MRPEGQVCEGCVAGRGRGAGHVGTKQKTRQCARDRPDEKRLWNVIHSAIGGSPPTRAHSTAVTALSRPPPPVYHSPHSSPPTSVPSASPRSIPSPTESQQHGPLVRGGRGRLGPRRLRHDHQPAVQDWCVVRVERKLRQRTARHRCPGDGECWGTGEGRALSSSRTPQPTPLSARRRAPP